MCEWAVRLDQQFAVDLSMISKGGQAGRARLGANAEEGPEAIAAPLHLSDPGVLRLEQLHPLSPGQVRLQDHHIRQLQLACSQATQKFSSPSGMTEGQAVPSPASPLQEHWRDMRTFEAG